MTKPRLGALLAAFVVCLGLTASPRAIIVSADSLPARLSDDEYWKIIDEFSEQNGYFQSDNLLSNEVWFQYVIPDLLARTKPGGVYMGVGPEQNFTYIAALKPKIVFITDIRRGNLWMHLMYKALFELSADRAEFMSRLFTKPRPAGLGSKSSAADIQNAFWDAESSPRAVYEENVRAIDDLLTKKRKLPLSAPDLQGIHDSAYYNFYWFGPRINYNSSSGRGESGNYITYAELMMSTDANGVYRSFLASEENFRVLKDLHERNLIIPLVGDFAGQKALRAVGRYLKEKGGTVTAFYLSNVEQYLQRNGVWQYFCGNVASLPLDDQSTFIRSVGGGGGRSGGLMNQLGAMRAETRGCGETAR
jgi:hypothetical protein